MALAMVYTALEDYALAHGVPVARDRLAKPYTLPMFNEKPPEPKPIQNKMEI